MNYYSLGEILSKFGKFKCYYPDPHSDMIIIVDNDGQRFGLNLSELKEYTIECILENIKPIYIKEFDKLLKE